MNPSQSIHLRVYYEDTDFSGVVYHAAYLRFMERGRTEFLRALGISQNDMHRESGFGFAVRKMTLDFCASARMDDLLTIKTELTEIGGASLLMRQSIWSNEARLVTAEVKIASVMHGKAARLPASLRENLRQALTVNRAAQLLP